MNLASFAEPPSVDAIYKWWEWKGEKEAPRTYLGASLIGHDCDRYLWYVFRQCVREKFEGRMLRLFERGKREESMFIRELRGIGCEVVDEDDFGNQTKVITLGGHFRGHLDAMILGLPEAPKSWHVGEFKTHNDSSFNKLKKDGVKASKPQHYAQMLVYMGLTKVDRAYYLAVNKNTDELYSERVHFDPAEFKKIMTRAKRIITSDAPCERVATRSDDWRCKMCAANKICWGNGEDAVCPLPRVNCRSCCHATPVVDDSDKGAWTCDLRLPMQEGCKRHLLLPGLMPSDKYTATPDGKAIIYTFKNTAALVNGEGGLPSTVLTKIPLDVALSTPLQEALKMFDGEIVEDSEETREALAVFPNMNLKLPDRYPPEDSRMVWEGTPFEIEGEPSIANIIEMEVTDRYEDASVVSVEYGKRFLLSVYSGHDYAVMWEGVE